VGSGHSLKPPECRQCNFGSASAASQLFTQLPKNLHTVGTAALYEFRQSFLQISWSSLEQHSSIAANIGLSRCSSIFRCPL